MRNECPSTKHKALYTAALTSIQIKQSVVYIQSNNAINNTPTNEEKTSITVLSNHNTPVTDCERSISSNQWSQSHENYQKRKALRRIQYEL